MSLLHKTIGEQSLYFLMNIQFFVMIVFLTEWGIIGLVLASMCIWRLIKLGMDFLRHAMGDKFKIAMGCFMVFWGCGEILMLLPDRILRYTCNPPHMIFKDAELYPHFYILASMLAYLALAMVVYYVVTFTWKNPLRYIPVVITLLPTITGPFALAGIINSEILRVVDYFAVSGATVVLLEYIYIWIKLGGDIRKRSFYISAGLIIIFIGKLIESNVVTVPLYAMYGAEFLEMVVAFSPLVVIAGTIPVEVGYGI